MVAVARYGPAMAFLMTASALERDSLNAVGAGKTDAMLSIFKCMRSTFQLMDLSCQQHNNKRAGARRDAGGAGALGMMWKHFITQK
jgi:hypothetical protein